MGDRSATHLWVAGTPSAQELAEDILGLKPEANDLYVRIWRTAGFTLIATADVYDRELALESFELVMALAKRIRYPWLFVNISVDHALWEVSNSEGIRLQHTSSSPASEKDKHVAKVMLTQRVPLNFTDVFDYTHWAWELDTSEEDVAVDGLSGLTRLEIPLPDAPPYIPLRRTAGQQLLSFLQPSKYLVMAPFVLLLLLVGVVGPLVTYPWLVAELPFTDYPASAISTLGITIAVLGAPNLLWWNKLPYWGRACVIGTHLLGMGVGLARGWANGM